MRPDLQNVEDITDGFEGSKYEEPIMNEKSCVGCKFLYARDSGYSNYTVMDTEIDCAINRNPNLPADEPYNRREDPDNWPKTQQSRCDRYEAGPMVHLDVDGEEKASSFTNDREVIEAIDGPPSTSSEPTSGEP